MRATETQLIAFAVGNGGYRPAAALLGDAKGNLYGTTEYGGFMAGCGGTGCGVVFELTPPAVGHTGWTSTVLYAFTGANGDGALPYARLIADGSGALYGTTGGGGNPSCGLGEGCGTIFKLTPPPQGQTAWTESLLYTFTGAGDGANPLAGLVGDAAGNLYGTTVSGGVNSVHCGSGCGTVFKLTPPPRGQTTWTESVLHAFTAAQGDGYGPRAGVAIDASDALYGTTESGNVFRLTPPPPGQTAWNETVLHRFTGINGYEPKANVILDANGALYGTTSSGGHNQNGNVFRLTPPAQGKTIWIETVLHAFTGSNGDGANPAANLIEDANGNFYGTTVKGGNGRGNSHYGTAFKLMPPAVGKTAWREVILYRFGNYQGDGIGPTAGLIEDANGNFYGTTYNGGTGQCQSGCGTVFKLAP